MATTTTTSSMSNCRGSSTRSDGGELSGRRCIRVFVADDRELVRLGLRRLVEREPGMALVGVADDTAAAAAGAESLRPDVLVMDAHMPGLCGAAAVREVRRRAPRVRILVVSACNDFSFGDSLRQAGADGFLPKSGVCYLCEAIRVVVAGGWYGPAASQAINNDDGRDRSFLNDVAKNGQW